MAQLLPNVENELEALDDQLLVQHQSTSEMQATIEKMQARLVKRAAEKRLSDKFPKGERKGCIISLAIARRSESSPHLRE
jgi:hypothetical protein